jgi:hypothetical protein
MRVIVFFISTFFILILLSCGRTEKKVLNLQTCNFPHKYLLIKNTKGKVAAIRQYVIKPKLYDDDIIGKFYAVRESEDDDNFLIKYDYQGYPVDAEYYNDTTKAIYKRVTLSFDRKGCPNLIKTYSHGNLSTTEELSFDSAKSVVRHTVRNINDSIISTSKIKMGEYGIENAWYYNGKGALTLNRNFTYNQKGETTFITDIDSNGTVLEIDSTTYNYKDNSFSKKYTIQGIVSNSIFFRDSNNMVIRSVSESKIKRTESKSEMEFDKAGNWIRLTDFNDRKKGNIVVREITYY